MISMVNSGLFVNTTPDKMEQVQKAIGTLKDVEINSVLNNSMLFIIVNALSMEEKKNILHEIKNIDGVASINLAYDHFEEGKINGQ